MRSRRALKAGGRYVATDGMRNFELAPMSRLGSRRVALPIARARKSDFLLVKQLLEDIVHAARYVETQQKTGNVVLTVSGDLRT